MRPKSEIYTPERDDEHPHPFHVESSPPGTRQSSLRETCRAILLRKWFKNCDETQSAKNDSLAASSSSTRRGKKPAFFENSIGVTFEIQLLLLTNLFSHSNLRMRDFSNRGKSSYICIPVPTRSHLTYLDYFFFMKISFRFPLVIRRRHRCLTHLFP